MDEYIDYNSVKVTKVSGQHLVECSVKRTKGKELEIVSISVLVPLVENATLGSIQASAIRRAIELLSDGLPKSHQPD